MVFFLLFFLTVLIWLVDRACDKCSPSLFLISKKSLVMVFSLALYDTMSRQKYLGSLICRASNTTKEEEM